MRRLIFCDLDGVLNGNSEFRKQYIPKDPSNQHDWLEWHKAWVIEPLNHKGIEMVKSLVNQESILISLSNRSKVLDKETNDRFKEEGNLVFDLIHNRSENLGGSAANFKLEALLSLIPMFCMGAMTTMDQVEIFLIDDDKSVINKVRKYLPNVCSILVPKFSVEEPW